MGKGDGKGRDGKGKSGKGKGRGKGADPEAAFKAFMRSQRETLQKWAQRRTQLMEAPFRGCFAILISEKCKTLLTKIGCSYIRRSAFKR